MKKITLILLAAALMFSIVACSKTDDTDNVSGNDASTNASNTDVSNDTSSEDDGYQLDYVPFMPNDTTMVGFGAEWNVEGLNMNRKEFKNKRDYGWFKIYGDDDDVGSFLMCEYTFHKVNEPLEWNGVTILQALSVYLETDDIQNETLKSTNPEDWEFIADIEPCVFETETAYYRFEKVGQESYDETFTILILPKANKDVTEKDGQVTWHGLHVIFNLSGGGTFALDKPAALFSESDYEYVCSVLKDTWDIELPSYDSLALSDGEPTDTSDDEDVSDDTTSTDIVSGEETSDESVVDGSEESTDEDTEE